MAINDILPQVEPVPGLGTDRRTEKPAFVTDVAPADSSYQRALSRSLNERGRKEPPASERTPAPEESAPPSADERPAPQPTEKPKPTRATEESNGSDRPQPTPRADAETGNERSDVTEVVGSETDTNNDDSATDAVNAAAVVISIQPPPAEISTGDYQEIKPPANLSTLFATTTTDEQSAVEVTTLDVETNGDESLRPPSGLFETLAANKGQQQSAAAEGLQTEPPQILPNAAVDTETLKPDVLPADQPETENSATPQDAENSNVSTDARAQNVALGQPTDIEIAQANAAARAAAAADSTNSDETPDGTSSSSTSSNAPVAANLTTGEETQRNRRTQSDETGRQQTDQQNSSTVTDKTTNSHTDSPTAPQPTSTQLAELVGDGSSGRRTDFESRTESTSDRDTSQTSVTAVRSDTAKSTIPVQGSSTSPSVSGTPLVDPEQLVERVATGIRAAPSNGQQLRVKLYPPHLGQLQIEVNSNSGTLSVRMEVQNVAAQNALNDNMSLLREALVQQGTSIDRIDVQLVETNAEEGRSDLTDEQQQQSRQESDDEQPNRDNEEPGSAEESDQKQQPVTAAHNMDELDIQV